jgi:peptidyl-dipeptidase Dcp
MKTEINIQEIKIRNEFKPGDMGYLIYLHGKFYKKEYNHGIEFETYVALGLCEFYKNFNTKKERIWICEHNSKIIGFLLLMNRGDAAQLRYSFIRPEYRGIGLGSKLLELYMEYFNKCGYKKSYLWTTNELTTAAHLYKKVGFKFTEEKESTNFGKSLKEQRYDLIVG